VTGVDEAAMVLASLGLSWRGRHPGGQGDLSKVVSIPTTWTWSRVFRPCTFINTSKGCSLTDTTVWLAW